MYKNVDFYHHSVAFSQPRCSLLLWWTEVSDGTHCVKTNMVCDCCHTKYWKLWIIVQYITKNDYSKTRCCDTLQFLSKRTRVIISEHVYRLISSVIKLRQEELSSTMSWFPLIGTLPLGKSPSSNIPPPLLFTFTFTNKLVLCHHWIGPHILQV